MNKIDRLWPIVLALTLLASLQIACGESTPEATPTPAATPTPSAEDHMDQGMADMESEQYAEAAAEFERAIALEPGDEDAYRNLGTAYMKQGLYDEAVAAYEKAIEINPEFGEAYGDLAGVYVFMEEYAQAIDAGEQAIELAPDYATAYNNLGSAYAEDGMFEEAIPVLQKAIELAPEDAMPHYNLGLIYRRQEDYEAAVAEYEQALVLKPDYVDARNNLAIIYYLQGDVEGAVAQWEQVIEIDPTHANAHKNLGIVYADEGLVEEAIAMFEEYLELAPEASDRDAVADRIAELTAQGATYSNAEGGYALSYPSGWYYTEDGSQVEFAETETLYEAGIEEAPIVLFQTGSLSQLADNIGIPATSDAETFWRAMAESTGVTPGQVESLEIDGYPAAAGDVSGSYQDVNFDGAIAVVLVDDRVMFVLGMAPPDTWDDFRPTFAQMLNSLTFFEPE